jgi:hypothetical protein
LAGDFCGHVQNWPEIFAVTCRENCLASAAGAGARRQRRSTQAAPDTHVVERAEKMRRVPLTSDTG